MSLAEKADELVSLTVSIVGAMRAKPNNTTGVIKMPNAGILRRKGRPPGYARNPSMVQDFAQGGARARGVVGAGAKERARARATGTARATGASLLRRSATTRSRRSYMIA
jgi:hypothetical protein